MTPGICRCCGTLKELCDSHAIPKAVFRSMLRGGAAVSLVDDESTPNANSTDSWDRPLLCLDCEREFNERFDQYGMKVLKGQTGAFDATAHGVRVSGVDQRRLAAFVTSVVWRASVSDHPAYAKLFALPPAVKRKLYDSLLDDPEGPRLPHVALARLVDSAEVFSRADLREVVLAPFLAKGGGKHAAFMVVSGFVLVLFFSPPTLRMRRSMCVLGTRPGLSPFYVPSRSFETFPPLFDLMVSALRKQVTGRTRLT